MQVAAIAGFWVLFAATHMAFSSQRLRPKLVARLGALGFQALYSLLALAIFVPLVSTYYAHKHTGAYLWHLSELPGVRWVGYGVMGAAFALVVAGLLQPSPASLRPGAMVVRGIARVTRHPVLMGFGLWGVAHLMLAQVHLAELAFFGGFPIFAVVGCEHQDQRKRAALGEPFRAYADATPFLPFASLRFAKGLLEMPAPVAITAGIALAWALREWAHVWLSGR
jgi:uncharacterized membrane protein